MKRLATVTGVAVVLAALAGLALAGDDPRPEPDWSNGSAALVPGERSPVVTAEARRLLARAAAAPQRTGFSGTQYVSAWSDGSDGSGDTATARVVEVHHDPQTGTTWRTAGNDRSPMRTSGAVAPSLTASTSADLLAAHYSLSVTGQAAVAGRPVDVVTATRPGRSAAPVARFWLDRATGLVLRREVYGDNERPIRASAFVEVTVWPAVPPAEADGSGGDEDSAWSESLDDAAVRSLRERGWTCPKALPGPLPLVDARRSPGSGALHLSYADGVSSVSLFAQRGRLDPDDLEGYRQDSVRGARVWTLEGVPTRLVWAEGGRVYTIVADAPPRTVEHAVHALHSGSDAGGAGGLDRLGRGLERVASWLNPLE